MLSEESAFIPFVTSDLPEGPWLVFSPHADDETFGMGGTLIKAASVGMETHLVVLTDGALGGEQLNLVDIRETEVEKAAAAMGIASLDCWKERDRALNFDEMLVADIVSKISQISPAAVFFPGLMEPHPDHRSASLLVWSALQGITENIRPEAYSYEISVQSPINLLVDITSQAEQKAEVMSLYNSQNIQNNYEELVTALDKGRTFSLSSEVDYAEGFYHYSRNQLKKNLTEVLVDLVRNYFRSY
jgi:LmbE family N-acetylglucosaminyl deacetylase